MNCRGCNAPLNQRFCNACGLDSQCRECGATLTAAFCGECGKPAASSATSNAPVAQVAETPRNRKPLVVIGVVVALLLIFGGIAAAVVIGGKSDTSQKADSGSSDSNSATGGSFACASTDFASGIQKGWGGSSGAEKYLTADIGQVKLVRDGAWALVPVSDKTSGMGYQSGLLLMHCDQGSWVIAEPIFSGGRDCTDMTEEVRAVVVELNRPCANRTPATPAPTTTSAAASNYQTTFNWMVRTADEKNMGQYCFAWRSGGGQGLVSMAEDFYVRQFGSSKTFDSNAVYAYYNGRC